MSLELLEDLLNLAIIHAILFRKWIIALVVRLKWVSSISQLSGTLFSGIGRPYLVDPNWTSSQSSST